VAQSDSYFSEGFLYQDILQSLKSSLSLQISPQTQSLSTEYRRSTIKANIFTPISQNSIDSHSFSTNSITSKDSLSKFNSAKNLINKESEENLLKSFKSRPSLLIQAKEDELKALMAARLRENQQQMVEFSKHNEKFLAEQQVLSYQKQQIKEKVESFQKIRNDDQAYAKQIDDRQRFMNRAEVDDYELRARKKAEYKEGLNRQFLEKDQEKLYLREIKHKMRTLLTPEPESCSSPVSPYSRCISPTSPGKSNLRFLAQYGNLIVSKK
jgi:hypothetical protein